MQPFAIHIVRIIELARLARLAKEDILDICQDEGLPNLDSVYSPMFWRTLCMPCFVLSAKLLIFFWTGGTLSWVSPKLFVSFCFLLHLPGKPTQ